MGGSGGVAGVSADTSIVVGLVSGSHLFNHLYMVLFPPILTVLASAFDVGLAALGFAMGLQAFVSLTLQLPFGYLADTVDRTVSLALCLGLGALGVWIIAAAPTFEWLLLGQAVLGAGVAGHHPAHFPLLSDASTERIRGRAFSVHGLAGNLGFAAPPVVIIGVTALPGTTWRHAFAVIAACGTLYAVAAPAILWRTVGRTVTRPHPPMVEQQERPRLILAAFREIKTLLGKPAVLGLSGVVMAAQTALWGITTYVVVFLSAGYGIDPAVASLVLTAIFVTGAVLILAGGVLTDRFRPTPVLAGAFGLVGLGALGLASTALPPVIAVATAVLAGSVFSLGIPARDKLTDTLSARRTVGRNFAVITIGIMLGNTVAPPLFGWLIEISGYGVTFTLIGVVGLVAAAGALVIGSRNRESDHHRTTRRDR